MKFSVMIYDGGDAGSRVARCSFQASVNEVTCDAYDVDYIARYQYVGHTKYFFFQGPFDVQIFADKTFVENNGRGSMAFGYWLTP